MLLWGSNIILAIIQYGCLYNLRSEKKDCNLSKDASRYFRKLLKSLPSRYWNYKNWMMQIFSTFNIKTILIVSWTHLMPLITFYYAENRVQKVTIGMKRVDINITKYISVESIVWSFFNIMFERVKSDISMAGKRNS